MSDAIHETDQDLMGKLRRVADRGEHDDIAVVARSVIRLMNRCNQIDEHIVYLAGISDERKKDLEAVRKELAEIRDTIENGGGI